MKVIRCFFPILKKLREFFVWQTQCKIIISYDLGWVQAMSLSLYISLGIRGNPPWVLELLLQVVVGYC